MQDVGTTHSKHDFMEINMFSAEKKNQSGLTSQCGSQVPVYIYIHLFLVLSTPDYFNILYVHLHSFTLHILTNHSFLFRLLILFIARVYTVPSFTSFILLFYFFLFRLF